MKPGPYDPCPCGSGKKYRFCCGAAGGAGAARSATATPVPLSSAPQLQRELSEIVHRGVTAHQGGRLADAEAAYRSVLAADPSHADALHLLGVVAYQSGNHATAIDLMRRAIAVNAQMPEMHAHLGHALQAAGRRDEAEQSYRAALRLRPAFVDVLNNLGLIEFARGATRYEAAAQLFGEALRHDARYVNAHMNLGALREKQGRLDDAEKCYRRLLEIAPQSADGANAIGTVMQARKRFAEAQRWYEQALALKPGYADAMNNLGAALEAQGNIERAVDTYAQAIALGGNDGDARLNLGALMQRQGHYDLAMAQFQVILERDPLHPRAHLNFGVAMHAKGRLHEALAHYLVTAAHEASVRELDGNIGTILRSLDRIDQAAEFFRRVVELDPSSVDAQSNFGSALFMNGRVEEAIAVFRKALELDAQHLDANWNLAMRLLAIGELKEGWERYESRIARERDTFHRPVRPFGYTTWSGEPVPGSGLLVFPEQGVGDELWFSGMYGEIHEKAGKDARVVIEASAKLVPLFRRSFPRAQVVAKRDPPDPACMQGIDFQIVGGSLPRLLRPELSSFPKRERYLIADSGREQYWRQRLAALGSGLKIGICWRSTDTRGERALACTRLAQWGAVLKLPGVQFVNLQYDESTMELDAAERAFAVKIHRFPEVDMFNDLDETAALMRGLDLVITAPTAVGVLSAALGAKTWLLNYGADWQRHGLAQNPWYPTMRLFERRWDQSWENVLAQVANACAGLQGRATVAASAEPARKAGEIAFDTASCALRGSKISDAIAALRTMGEDEPGMRELNRALALPEGGRALDDRLALVAAEVAAGFADFQLQFGNALRVAGRIAPARALVEAAARREPESATAWEAMAELAHVEGDTEKETGAWSRAFEFDPSQRHVRESLSRSLDAQALALIEQDRSAEALPLLQRALALDAAAAETHYRLGYALQDLGRMDEAVASYRRALELTPDFVPALNNLGNALRSCARLDDALECFRRALAIDPNLHGVRSNLLLTLNYAEDVAPEAFFAEHREYGERVARGLQAPPAPAGTRDGAKRLRIGYVSADFRAHAVSRFFEPLLARHDRGAFEIHCYAAGARSDVVTARLRELADHWASLVGMDDDAAANMIRADGIDILVDLSGHTALNRLPVFARKPAPVQVSYLGYPATTGLAAMDYRIVDAMTLPRPEELQPCSTETFWQLEGPMWAYAPDQGMPERTNAPAPGNGHVTFASFNSVVKLGPGLLRRFAQVMVAVPGSRLMLATVPEGETRRRIGALFESNGVDRARLEFHDRLPPGEFRALHRRADLALDAFPCNGGTTTFETLWMGVPVIALDGARDSQLVSRVSAGILRGLGLAELIAADEEDYVQRAIALAGDAMRLAALHGTLRNRLETSAYLDHAARCRSLEAAYRAMWQRWCKEKA